MNFYENWIHVTRINDVDNPEPFSTNEWGYVADETGLGYYRPVGDDVYVVTHLASGYAIADYAGEEHARAFVEAIAALTDWTQPAKVLVASPQLAQEVRRADTLITGVKRRSTKHSQKLLQVARAIAEQSS